MTGELHESAYLRACNGRLRGILRWPELDALWARLRQGGGIVYVDDFGAPSFVKIYDPGNLGMVCGSSDVPTLPGWTLSRAAPVDLDEARRPPRDGRRWWRKLLGTR